MLTQDRLREIFTYDADTGHLMPSIKRSGRVKMGVPAGALDYKGYRKAFVDGKAYFVHRLVWLYHYGNFPSKDIDHINRVRDDNRIENLREVTAAENNRNSGPRSYIKSRRKAKGYSYYNGRYRAFIYAEGKRHFLGSYKTAEEANSIYLVAAELLTSHPMKKVFEICKK